MSSMTPRFVKQIASPDQIAMMVPPGESDLKSQKPKRKGERIESESEEHEALEVENEPEDNEEEIEKEFGKNFGKGTEEEFKEKLAGEIPKNKAREGTEEEIEMHGGKKA